MRIKFIMAFCSCFLLSSVLFGQQPGNAVLDIMKLIQPGASLQLISDQFSFTEGPAVDKGGNIFFYGSA